MHWRHVHSLIREWFATYWLHNHHFFKLVPLDRSPSYLVHHMPSNYAPGCNDLAARHANRYQLANFEQLSKGLGLQFRMTGNRYVLQEKVPRVCRIPLAMRLGEIRNPLP